MRRCALTFLICGLLGLVAGAASASPAPPDTAIPDAHATPPEEILPQEASPEAASPEEVMVTRRPYAAPLPSAGLGGLTLLSLMMLRRWFRQRI